MPNDDIRVAVAVDDTAADVLTGLLTAYGYTPCIAPGGPQALALLAQFQPHCVLLDARRVGDDDGLELARRVRQHYGDDVVLVAVVGPGTDDRRLPGELDIVDHHLTLPIDAATFAKVFPPVV